MNGRRITQGLLLFVVAAAAYLLLHSGGDKETAPTQTLAVPADCDLGQGPCEIGDGGLRLRVVLETPVPVMRPFRLAVQFSGPGAAAVESVRADFSMPGMNMGVNRYRLLGQGEGVWQAEVTLPVCISGRSDWRLTLDVDDGQRIRRLLFPFRAQVE
ncbi:hypothetical protein QVG61_10575 [Thiohalobacter sp. IOR34]|uniref:hypothetical protein n=1 Tax=Thiohalobacter sp. IOR34 TaxID=3057176 RepID=UPI0025B21BCD|nr:hypothetical protein [Thiohalobacter sp. IOR34]WJW74940.1 hypothetical protein QVG61_10575 [Thiohalobacter sp. IOR34]